jgi:hypothetical protein
MRLRAALLFAASLAVILLFSCEVTPEEYEGEPNIYAVLCTDSSFACIMVGRTLSVEDTMKVGTIIDTVWYDDTFYTWVRTVFPWNGVSGAEVVLKHDAQSFSAGELEDSAGYYYAAPIAFSAGQTWGLEVSYPGGESVAAQTTFPGEFEILSPTERLFNFDDSLTWSESAGTKGYRIWMIGWGQYQDEDSVYADSMVTYVVEYDWHIRLTRKIKGDDLAYFVLQFLECDSIQFRIAALDSNIYDYFDCWGEENKEEYMYIQGAWGVLGSQTVVRSKSYVFSEL